MSENLQLPAREIMTADVKTVREDTSVEQAARMMFEGKISGLPVVDNSDHLTGVVTEFDVIAKSGETVADIMSRDVISIGEETDSAEIAGLLIERRIRRLPVVRHGKVIGIISRSDLVRLFALTRWSCEDCGFYTRGFERLEKCPKCGSKTIVLEREPPGS